MKLIVGLGNPEKLYDSTRHNVGFRILEAFAAQQGTTFQASSKFHGDIAEYSHDGEKVLLLKPMTYYNNSGQSFRAVLDFYKIDPNDTLVVHDELALSFGTIRARVGGSDAGNNGIKSIVQHGGEHTARLRIGIANDQRALLGDSDFVLARFSKDEEAALQASITPKALDMLAAFITDSHEVTSHKLL